MYLNKAIIIGNLTRDPEIRAIPSGMQVCSFSVATNRVWKDKDGNKKEQADFHNIVVFGRQAETAGPLGIRHRASGETKSQIPLRHLGYRAEALRGNGPPRPEEIKNAGPPRAS